MITLPRLDSDPDNAAWLKDPSINVQEIEAPIRLDDGFALVLKTNPYHDATGAFVSKDKAVAPKSHDSLLNVGPSEERMQIVDLRLALAGSIGSYRGAVMNSLSPEEKVSYVERYMDGKATSEFDYDAMKTPEVVAILRKYHDVSGGYLHKPDDIYAKMSDEDVKGVGELLESSKKMGGSYLAVDDLVRGMNASEQTKLLERAASIADPKMPEHGTVVYDPEMGAGYNTEIPMKLNVELNSVFKSAMSITRYSKLGGDGIDSIVDKIKPTTASRFGLGMYHKDRDAHMNGFWGSWTITGGTSAQIEGGITLSDFHVNKNGDFWKGEKNSFVPPPSENLRKHLEQTYKETQEFYERKLNSGRTKIPLDQREITVYRGVGKSSDVYVPGDIEAWSTQKSTGVRFAKMMGEIVRDSSRTWGPPPRRLATLLTTKVKMSDVFASFESLAPWFPSEKVLKGKKEHIIFGGALKTITAESVG